MHKIITEPARIDPNAAAERLAETAAGWERSYSLTTARAMARAVAQSQGIDPDAAAEIVRAVYDGEAAPRPAAPPADKPQFDPERRAGFAGALEVAGWMLSTNVLDDGTVEAKRVDERGDAWAPIPRGSVRRGQMLEDMADECYTLTPGEPFRVRKWALLDQFVAVTAGETPRAGEASAEYAAALTWAKTNHGAYGSLGEIAEKAGCVPRYSRAGTVPRRVLRAARRALKEAGGWSWKTQRLGRQTAKRWVKPRPA